MEKFRQSKTWVKAGLVIIAILVISAIAGVVVFTVSNLNSTTSFNPQNNTDSSQNLSGTSTSSSFQISSSITTSTGTTTTSTISPKTCLLKKATLERTTSVLKDMAYANESSKQELDVYYPSEGNGPFPVVVYIHGGGWAGGTKNFVPNSVSTLPDEGYVLISVGYRLTFPTTNYFPTQIHDVKAAIRWIRANSEYLNLNTDEIIVWGTSAGGHLAALLGTSYGIAELEGSHLGNPDCSSKITAVINQYGPMSLIGITDILQSNGCGLSEPEITNGNFLISRFLGGSAEDKKELAIQADPITHITSDDAIFLSQHGTNDCIVPVQHSQWLHGNLTETGVPSMITIFENEIHGGSIFETTENTQTIISFIKSI